MQVYHRAGYIKTAKAISFPGRKYQNCKRNIIFREEVSILQMQYYF
jgi:hypothetical protein